MSILMRTFDKMLNDCGAAWQEPNKNRTNRWRVLIMTTLAGMLVTGALDRSSLATAVLGIIGGGLVGALIGIRRIQGKRYPPASDEPSYIWWGAQVGTILTAVPLIVLTLVGLFSGTTSLGNALLIGIGGPIILILPNVFLGILVYSLDWYPLRRTRWCIVRFGILLFLLWGIFIANGFIAIEAVHWLGPYILAALLGAWLVMAYVLKMPEQIPA
jgi:hypothetical protein